MMQALATRWDRPAALQSDRIELLYLDESEEALEDFRENALEHEGQFISLDLAASLTESFAEMFYTALKNARWDSSLQFSLPFILQHNPRVASPFINRAILWQRLCDLLIMDDTADRETVLVLENIEQASPGMQHEIARLIRFHDIHSIRRMFVFTLERYAHDQIIPELRNILIPDID
jgi:hypothetical protein